MKPGSQFGSSSVDSAGIGELMPIVSVVIAAFRAEQFIESSIRSALSQTIDDLEVVVVNDGSDDGTEGVVRSIGDARVRLINQDNRGQSAALNRGAAESRGKYLKFLDADDQLNPLHLQSQLQVLENSTTDVASCRWGYFVSDANLLHIRDEITNRNYSDPLEWIVDSLSRDEGMMGGWMWLIPRYVWNRCGGWNEILSLNNDFDFSIRLLLASSGVRYAPDAVYAYREGVTEALSGRRTRAAMESAFLTTELGCTRLLERENSSRIASLCANRYQRWLYVFYPEFPDLAMRAEVKVRELGGSNVSIEGGRILRFLSPLIGWKAVRQIQIQAYRSGWAPILRWKSNRRLASLSKDENL
jgi:glycosyltransferase involved in cell wall biosynthesis